jgi:hypothetical protein
VRRGGLAGSAAPGGPIPDSVLLPLWRAVAGAPAGFCAVRELIRHRRPSPKIERYTTLNKRTYHCKTIKIALFCRRAASTGRIGPVLDGRYHHRLLRTPREVRRALAYVLLNARRHLQKRRRPTSAGSPSLDPASSARWFDGWRRQAASRLPEARGHPEIARPRTWLLRIGWRRHGLVDPSETPGAAVERVAALAGATG